MSNDRTQREREHISANACNLEPKVIGLQIRISGLIRIRVSAGSLSKCNGFIPLSASYFSPSFIKAAGDCTRNANRLNAIFCSVERNGKVYRNPCQGPDRHQKLTDSSHW